MATKDKKPDDEQTELLHSLKDRIEEDRQRLSKFLSNLISAVDGVSDPLTTIGAADAVAKIGDTLTRQNHLTIEAMKILGKRNPKQEKDDIYGEVGRPFSLEDDIPEKDGSN